MIFVFKKVLIKNTNLKTPSQQSFVGLQHVFSVIILRLPRRLEDAFKTSSRRFGRRKILRSRRLQDFLRTCLEDVWKTSLRRIRGKQNVYWWYLYLTNLSVYLANLCSTNLYLTNLWRMRHLEPNNFDIRLILKHISISILRIEISEIREWASEARKTKF